MQSKLLTLGTHIVKHITHSRPLDDRHMQAKLLTLGTHIIERIARSLPLDDMHVPCQSCRTFRQFADFGAMTMFDRCQMLAAQHDSARLSRYIERRYGSYDFKFPLLLALRTGATRFVQYASPKIPNFDKKEWYGAGKSSKYAKIAEAHMAGIVSRYINDALAGFCILGDIESIRAIAMTDKWAADRVWDQFAEGHYHDFPSIECVKALCCSGAVPNPRQCILCAHQSGDTRYITDLIAVPPAKLFYDAVHLNDMKLAKMALDMTDDHSDFDFASAVMQHSARFNAYILADNELVRQSSELASDRSTVHEWLQYIGTHRANERIEIHVVLLKDRVSIATHGGTALEVSWSVDNVIVVNPGRAPFSIRASSIAAAKKLFGPDGDDISSRIVAGSMSPVSAASLFALVRGVKLLSA